MPGLEGTTLGRYRLKHKLGLGGMSQVYLAYDEDLDRDVAVKVVNSSQEEYIERFKREAKAIGRLTHEHILPAFDSGEQGLWHFLVMPYIEHNTLRERLERGDLTLQEAGELLQQIASALQCAHDNGIVHRDIKPSNILLRDDHYAYLADFGLAKSLEGASDLTQLGTLLGTPEYMAPELADGPATTSSDIYALGVLLYQMVTGRVPFDGETPVAIYMKQLREEPIPPSYINPAIPPAIEQVILRALAKDPLYRYQTAIDLAQAYMEAFEASTTSAEPPSFYETTDMEEEVLPVYPEVASMHVETPPYVVLQPAEQLVLPSDPGEAPSAIPSIERGRSAGRRSFRRTGRSELRSNTTPRVRTTRGASKPSRPSGPVTPPGPASSTPYSIYRPSMTRQRQRRSPRNAFLVTGLMGFSLLLFVTALVVFALIGRGNAPQLDTGGVVTPQSSTLTTPSPATSPGAQSTTPQSTASVNVQATQQAAAATITAVTGTTPLLKDTLSSDTNNRWPNDGINCIFRDGTYHVVVTSADYLQPCELDPQTFDNSAMQVDVSLLSGNNAGLIFRANSDQFYDFEINSNGEFFFRRHDAGAGSKYVYLVRNTQSAAIAPYDQKNRLLVLANGSDFKLFINGTFVGEARDSTYISGKLGLVAGTLSPNASGEAGFANLRVWNV
ncbi:MAG TPA: protein kinase [Ktedonobacteraceae bacterium]